MRRLNILFLTLTGCISTAYAAQDMCVYPKGFAAGLDFAAYQQCAQAIQSCPPSQFFREEKCAAKKLQQPSCKQVAALAKHFKLDAQMISAEDHVKYATIKIFYPADGGEQFYILSPKGCLVDPVAAFKREFTSKDLYIEATSVPAYSAMPNDGKRFTTTVEGRDQCRACAVLITADVAFEFGKDDVLGKVSVVKK